ncbi:hypothetical protein ACFPH6_14755 [Streptomyces xiangluensis]|uniref:ATP-grasp domain-containing protein n=1 Tax=Streptomyces xiangluensis TaxID=2665720 RepID=A0ABV8YRJ4_9ACTN
MTAVRTAHWGTFDAERWWRPSKLATLPAVAAPRGAAAVAAMDELLAGFCAPGDLLVTRHPVARELLDGLAGCGITFEHHAVAAAAPGTDLETVDQLITADRAALERIGGCAVGRPYAVVPGTAALAGRLGWSDQLPPVAAVAEVNSKSWSNDLVRKLGLPGAGRMVRSVGELADAVADYGWPAVVKDPYGVSGRDTLEIPTPGVLTAVQRTLRRQSEAGKNVELVVQPKFTVRRDFSGHVEVSRAGGVTVLGVQIMTNQGFRHAGSRPADPAFLGFLETNGYFDVLTEVADAVADAGYWGPVGVDSMILADGTSIPVLEINARRSLGLLSLSLDQQVRGSGLRCHLRQLDLAVPAGLGIGALCAALRRDGYLYRGDSRPGVTVLSGSALSHPGGRVHCAVFCGPDGPEPLQRRVAVAAAAAGMTPRGGTDAT